MNVEKVSSISVVIPTRDTRELTLKCIASVERASKPGDAEIAVVDDGSRDGTTYAVRGRFSHVRVVRHEAPAGFSAAANAGLRHVTGSVCLLLNSDTEVDAGGLDAMLKAFAGDSQLGIAGGRLRYPDGRPQWSGGSAPTLPWLFAQASHAHVALARLPGYRSLRPLGAALDRQVEWVTGAALAMRREVWDAVGPFDDAFRLYAQDLDFCLRAGAAGWRVAIVAGFGVMHHHGATVRDLEGAAGPENPALLWRDLLYWARKQHGDDFARRARMAIIAGARLRLAARSLARPARAGGTRTEWEARTNALRAALASLYAEAPPATHV